MIKKLIVKNKTTDLVDIVILSAVDNFLNNENIKAELDIYGSTIITFSDYVCLAKKLKSGTITLTFMNNQNKEKADD